MLAQQRTKQSQPRQPPRTIPSVANIVKTLRLRAALTLSELADLCGVSTSTVSKIEAGQLSPGYEIILRLARGLGVEVAELFEPRIGQAPTGRRSVTKNAQGVAYETPQYSYEALANDVANKGFIPLRARIKARDRLEWGELPSHEGEEFIFVASGAVTIYSDHYEPLELQRGDSIYFDSRSGHALVSTSDEDADIIWICTHPDAIKVIKGR